MSRVCTRLNHTERTTETKKKLNKKQPKNNQKKVKSLIKDSQVIKTEDTEIIVLHIISASHHQPSHLSSSSSSQLLLFYTTPAHLQAVGSPPHPIPHPHSLCTDGSAVTIEVLKLKGSVWRWLKFVQDFFFSVFFCICCLCPFFFFVFLM